MKNKLNKRGIVMAVVLLFLSTGTIAENSAAINNSNFEFRGYDSNIITSTIQPALFDEKIIFQQSISLTGGITAFYSDDKKCVTVYEDFWQVNEEITRVTWWGMPMQRNGDKPGGTIEDTGFIITFYDDTYGRRISPPNESIKDFYASSYLVEIQGRITIVLDGMEIILTQFSYGLPSPIKFTDGDGWLSIKSYEDDEDDYFAWLKSDQGNKFLYHCGGPGGRSNDVAFALYAKNYAPYQPSKPVGETFGDAGVIYSYTTQTEDPESNEIFYKWEWGDGKLSDWLGPYMSGESCEASHKWNKKNEYQIRVKAKDNFGAESPWSDPLAISMPKIHSYNPIIQLILKMLERYPFLQSFFFS
jgi:hypothetical protein